MKNIFDIRTIVIGAAVAGIAVLGSINLWMFNKPVDISADITAIPVEQAVKANQIVPGENTSHPLEITETVARPLFSPTRREFVPKPQIVEPVAQPVVAVAAVPKTPIKKPAISFQGTSQMAGRIAALIANEDGSNSNWMTLGQNIGEWKIAAIEAGQIVMTFNNERAVYSLYAENGNHVQ